MNKQEAIEQVKNKALHHCGEKECYKDGCEKSIELNTALEIINQIDEPQKVKIPKFVAEWIEDMKNAKTEFFEAQSNCMSDEVDDWYYNHADDLLRAWLDGFEIEQEKLYTVEIPNPNATHDDAYILGRTLSGSIAIWRSIGRNGNKNYESDFQLTESEIKEDFEWAWQFAKEVEEDK